METDVKSKDQVLDDIVENRRRFGQPLPGYVFNLGMPLLLNPEESPLSCRETVQEFEKANHGFSGQMRSLFGALEAAQDPNTNAVAEQKPLISKDGFFLTVKIQLQSFDRYLDCLHRTYHSRRLWLEDPAALPQLSCVTKLRLYTRLNTGAEVHFADARPVSLCVPLELLVRLPNIEELECPLLWERLPIAFQAPPLRHYTRPWEGPWRDSRHDFGRAVHELNGQMPVSWRKARLWFWRLDWLPQDDDQSIQMPNLVHPADICPVSLGLRTLASQLEELDLRAFLTPHLFDVQTPWPRMKRLRIEFHPWRPDGRWYFVGPRGENPNPEGFHVLDKHYPPAVPTDGDEEIDDQWAENEAGWEQEDRLPDMFRTEPLADQIEPLLEAFAKALKTMTDLDEAELFTYLVWNPSEERRSDYGDAAPYYVGLHRWGVRYCSAKDGSKASLEWQVGAWRPSEDIINLFEALDEDRGVKMTWKMFDFTDTRAQTDNEAYH
jgi:hypothetical protein